MRSNVMSYLKKHDVLHAVPFFIYMVLYLLCFHLLEIMPREHFYEIVFPIDRKIPFLEIFVIPYLSWFLYIFVGCAIVFIKDKELYDRLTTVLMLGMTAFLVISALVPNCQTLRLATMPRDNVFTSMVSALWKTDTPTNVWPSIHVFNSVAVVSALVSLKGKFFSNRAVKAAEIIWAVLICLSTFFIKQHSLFDAMTALVMYGVFYRMVYANGYVFRFQWWAYLSARWYITKGALRGGAQSIR
jgi:hypothetical protein